MNEGGRETNVERMRTKRKKPGTEGGKGLGRKGKGRPRLKGTGKTEGNGGRKKEKD